MCNQGASWNGAVLDLCLALGNARVKDLFEMLFIAQNPAVAKALIPARRDTALPLSPCVSLPEVLQPANVFGCDLCN